MGVPCMSQSQRDCVGSGDRNTVTEPVTVKVSAVFGRDFWFEITITDLLTEKIYVNFIDWPVPEDRDDLKARLLVAFKVTAQVNLLTILVMECIYTGCVGIRSQLQYARAMAEKEAGSRVISD